MENQIQISDLIERLKYLQEKTGDIFMPVIPTSEGIICYVDFRFAQPSVFDFISNISIGEETNNNKK